VARLKEYVDCRACFPFSSAVRRTLSATFRVENRASVDISSIFITAVQMWYTTTQIDLELSVFFCTELQSTSKAQL